MKRIGPKMIQVVNSVAHRPRALIDVAREVGPNGSTKFGYAIVARAAKAGLVIFGPPLKGRHGRSLYPARPGMSEMIAAYKDAGGAKSDLSIREFLDTVLPVES